MRVVNYFLMGCKTHSTKTAHTRSSYQAQEAMTRQVINPRGELTNLLLLNEHNIKATPMTHHYTHGLVHFSSIIRQASFGSIWQLAQRPSTGQGTENKRWQNVQASTSILCFLFLRLSDLCEEEEQRESQKW